jgi:predicted MFS family arabinose efflux permease
VPPLVGFIAQASNLRWSFAFVALFGALITVFISQTSSPQPVTGNLQPPKNAPLIDDF